MKYSLIILILVGTFSYSQRSDFDTIDFSNADSIARKYKGAHLKNLPFLAHNLTENLTTDVEKFRAIYTWVCTNIENDYGAYQKTLKKRKKFAQNQEALTEWNDDFAPKMFKKLLTQKKTACTGYAFLVRELANLADINCKIINGYGRTATLHLDSNSIPNHAWNAVEINNKWYLCDPTWSAGRIVLEENGAKFEADYFDGYFLAAPGLFIKNHFPLDSSWSLIDDTPTLNTFMQGPVVYKAAFAHTIRPIAPSEMHLEIMKNEQIAFTMTSQGALDHKSIFLALHTGSSSSRVHPIVTQHQNDYVLQYTFKKTGKYDVHITIADTIIATYVVKVKRK